MSPAMDFATQAWWAVLCTLALVNLAAWSVAASVVLRRGAADACAWPSRTMLLLSAGYVVGCAYRSVLPVYDIQRWCLVDGPWSSVLVGRSVATVAELCFAAQWAVALRHVAQVSGSGLARHVSASILPMIVGAEICSWAAVLTTSNLGHVIEESLWGVSAALVALSLSSRAVRDVCKDQLRTVVAVCTAAAVVYALYMFAVDVPMYWSRHVADELAAQRYLGLADGFNDVATRWTVTGQWSHWRSEVVWMTLYFSVAVWLSIGLVRAPQWPQWQQGAPARSAPVTRRSAADRPALHRTSPGP